MFTLQKPEQFPGKVIYKRKKRFCLKIQVLFIPQVRETLILMGEKNKPLLPRVSHTYETLDTRAS